MKDGSGDWKEDLEMKVMKEWMIWQYTSKSRPRKELVTQMERAEEQYQRKIILPPPGKTHNALRLRESRHRTLCAQWLMGRFPRNPHLNEEMLGGLGVWCVKTLKSISKPIWTEKEEMSIVRAINIILNHTD